MSLGLSVDEPLAFDTRVGSWAAEEGIPVEFSQHRWVACIFLPLALEKTVFLVYCYVLQTL